MFKIKRTFRVFGDKPPKLKEELDKIRKTMFRLLFALAMALKITPKKLAKFYDEKKMDNFAQDFHDELLIADDKEAVRSKKAVLSFAKKASKILQGEKVTTQK